VRSGLDGVRALGYVAERDMPAIMAGATVFAYPSLYEGFGFPVVEAMAAGVPVLTASAGSLPEIAGDAAYYVDPLSVTEIRTALERLLTSPEQRRGMIQRGSKQARRYSWRSLRMPCTADGNACAGDSGRARRPRSQGRQ
jgi:alpha-1,3-rhamnosyl/mannosyltransferase